MKIRGKIVDGLRVAADFTQIPWVKSQFASKLSIEAYPGTLNLEILEPEDLQVFACLKNEGGVEITPEHASFCSARCYPVLIAGKVRGAIVFPCVTDYPANKMELIAHVHVRETLHAEAGDILEVEIL
ncbi:MAG: CTP-dependent riboflavin kinase [Deltaproteobacteria bacterium]|nr:CTP-dependent riboflavin kinase [Deltaproteobacteria bacterium]